MTIKTHTREAADKIKAKYPETDWDTYYEKLEADNAEQGDKE